MAYRRFKQQTPRGWSQWMEMARMTQMACCSCGLVHTHHYAVAVYPRSKKVAVYLRVRVHKARTRKRRRQMNIHPINP